jgi:hypothetical protein
LFLAAAWAAKPSVLICSPSGAAYGYVDLDYLKELVQAGFEVDYTDHLGQITAERIKRYNALLVFMTPDFYEVGYRGQPSSPERVAAFRTLIDGYLDAGGGVFLFAGENHMGKQAVAELTERWGLRFPVERLREADKEKMGVLTHSCQETEIAYTDQVLASPVSQGVGGIWYPCRDAYNGGQGGPIVVDGTWVPVVRASATTKTVPVDLSKSPSAIANPFIRPEGETAPVMMAIRAVSNGRVAVLNQWQQFSIGAGTKWIYDRQVLDRGYKGKPSGFNRLLKNTLGWLAEPSLKSGTLGGYVTDPVRLLPPNANSPEVKKQYAERTVDYDPAKLGTVQIPMQWHLYKGLIGAKTTYSTGTGTVADYAQAARKAGLDFLVFLDDFDKLTPAKLAALQTDCVKYSDDKLLLLAGFTIDNNVGNHMFFFAPDPVWPKDMVLTGPNKSLMYLQEENDKGGWTGMLAPYLDWVLGTYHVEGGQVGYYNFSGSPHGMRLHDCRLYSAVALRYYKDGKLVEDNTPDYLTTAQCTIAPNPFGMNEVTSPDALLHEAAAGRGLTYGQAENLERNHRNGVFMRALRWTHQYDGPNVFCSEGPLIHAWPNCHRVWALGGEEFVRGNAVMPSPISITAEKGLKEIRIYNGERLYRRIRCNGAPSYQQTLMLDGTVYKNLVLIAEDMAGNKATSFSRRCWKDGALAPSFCSDHVNDGGMFMAHGPYELPFGNLPTLSMNLAGDTWDGGPPASMPLTNYQHTIPYLESDKGKQDAGRMDQIPLLEISDEGCVAACQLRKEMYDDRIERIVNPWHTYGPIGDPAPLFEHITRYRQYVTPTVGVPDNGWAAQGVRTGVSPSLFTGSLRFTQDQVVTRLQLGTVRRSERAMLVIGTADGVKTIDLTASGYPEFPLKKGEWFGYFAKAMGNAQLFVNRAADIRIRFTGEITYMAEIKDQPVKKDETYTFELAGYSFPLDVPITGAADFQRYVDYVRNPPGLQITRGTRLDSPGLIEVKAQEGAVALAVPRPAQKLSLTLPLKVTGLNPRWAAGLFQRAGYSKGYYGSGENRYRALGTDLTGSAFVPLYVDWVDRTDIVAGHPVVAGPDGADLYIQVTNLGGTPDRWHVSVNNPTDKPITTRLHQAIPLPGLTLADQQITVGSGEYTVIQ